MCRPFRPLRATRGRLPSAPARKNTSEPVRGVDSGVRWGTSTSVRGTTTIRWPAPQRTTTNGAQSDDTGATPGSFTASLCTTRCTLQACRTSPQIRRHSRQSSVDPGESASASSPVRHSTYPRVHLRPNRHDSSHLRPPRRPWCSGSRRIWGTALHARTSAGTIVQPLRKALTTTVGTSSTGRPSRFESRRLLVVVRTHFRVPFPAEPCLPRFAHS